MRNSKILSKAILYVLLLSVISLNSCKKESSDQRDKFVGTWTGNLYFSRIGQEFSVTEIISKSATNSAQIIFTEQGSSSAPLIATINGDSYIYQNYTTSIGVSGNYAGGGSINGNVLTESGTITSDGSPFQGNLGTWGRILNKQ
jgi:hypothetical protein